MSRGVGVTEALVEALPAWLVDLSGVVALLGDLVVIVPALAGLYLLDVVRGVRGDRSTEQLCSDRTAFLVATVFGGLALVVALEAVFAAPRPPTAWHAVEPSAYGFPSGHAMAATVFWGALALWTRRWSRSRQFTVAAVVVALVAVSRLALGVHYLVDVIASVAFGVGYLFVAGRLAAGRPERAFPLAIAIALVAVAVTGGSGRATLAFLGTVGAGAGWWLTERPPVRRRVRGVLSRSR